MSELRFAQPEWLWAVPAALLLFVLLVLLVLKGRRRLQRFIDARLLPAMAPARSARRPLLRGAAVALALALVAVAMARPLWGKQRIEMPRVGRDVVLLIDVSRSMLARDVRPNRLAQAKLWAGDVIDALPQTRIGVVAFAGSSVVKSPLTMDHAFARMAVANLDTEAVRIGGTNIGDAIRMTLSEVFDLDSDRAAELRRRDIILITDGGDMQSLPVQAAAVAGQAGVRIIVVGVGSTEAEGVPIPLGPGAETDYVMYQGERVLTKLESELLADIARASGGLYLQVGTGTIDLGREYRKITEAAAREAAKLSVRERGKERFQWPLLAAIALAALEPWLPLRARRRAS